MSKLKKFASQELYHATTLDNLRQIISSGSIAPQAGSGVGMINTVEYNKGDLDNVDFTSDDWMQVEEPSEETKQNYNGFVFLTTDLWVAESYAYKLANLPNNPAVILSVNLDDSVLLPDDVDDPDAKTWKDSATSIQQVKVGEPITTEEIKKVYFLNAHGETISDVSLGQVEEEYKELAEDGQFDNSSGDFDLSYLVDDDEEGYSYDPEKEKQAREENERKFKELKEKLSDYKVDKKEGFIRIFDCPVDKAVQTINSVGIEISPDYWNEDDYNEDSKYLEVNVDKQGECFVTTGLYESYSPSPVVFKSTDGGQNFEAEISKQSSLTPGIKDTLKTMLSGKTIRYENQSYSIDELFQTLSVGSEASIRSRLKKIIGKSY